MRIIVVLMSVWCLLGCEKSKPAASVPAQPKKEALAAGKAEVEFFGKWSGLAPARTLFVAQVEPCVPVPEKPTRYGETKLDTPEIFAEYFIPQGAKGYACVYGFDESGKVIGAAGTSQNPMTFEGQGEVMFGKLEFVLQAP